VQLDAATLGPRIKGDFEPHGLAPLCDARAWRLVCAATERGLLVQLAAQYDDHAQATAGIEALGKLQKTLVEYFNEAGVQVPALLREQAAQFPEGAKIADVFGGAMKRFSEGLKQGTPKTGGSMLAIIFHMKTDTPASDAICLLTLMPRGAVQPGDEP
jgi:hypothetical protein